MAEAPRLARLAAHVPMAALFALGIFWTLREAWNSLQEAGVSWRVVLWMLAALGFVLLTVREMRAVNAARGGRDRATSGPPAG